ncbi:hypothetical protein [Paenibacillus lemnae]|uniref:Helicase XPB/Ssl2 N-terminal domain-containing protein n=1 Tax=Paenibacillus lemnae TaxID=1330551 RepID=A0A848M9Q2_PAELE|nr:hypothetical protein [Paenibacillus lemnae]NMO96989.1 hypothetical protein [Paenibacillus lemnae]
MNLADMLSFADIGHLSQIANHYQCDCKRNSKHELIQSILVKTGGRDFLQEQMNHLTITDLRFLNSLIFDTRRGYSLEDLIASIRQTAHTGQKSINKPVDTAENPREVVSRYRRSGWLFNGFTASTKYTFHVPQDLKERFKEVLLDKVLSQRVLSGQPEVYRDEQGLFLNDIQLFLKYVEGHEIELNAEGFMYRKHQQQLFDTLHISEPLVAKGTWRFGYGRSCTEYPDRFALLYDYAFSQQWVQENGSCLALTEKGKEFQLSGNQVSVIQLFRFWLRIYKGAIPNLISLVYWTSQSARDWMTLKSLQDAVGWLITPFYYDSPQVILDQRIVKMLMHFGMLRIGESAEYGTVVRMTALGMKAADAAVQI